MGTTAAPGMLCGRHHPRYAVLEPRPSASRPKRAAAALARRPGGARAWPRGPRPPAPAAGGEPPGRGAAHRCRPPNAVSCVEPQLSCCGAPGCAPRLRQLRAGGPWPRRASRRGGAGARGREGRSSLGVRPGPPPRPSRGGEVATCYPPPAVTVSFIRDFGQTVLDQGAASFGALPARLIRHFGGATGALVLGTAAGSLRPAAVAGLEGRGRAIALLPSPPEPPGRHSSRLLCLTAAARSGFLGAVGLPPPAPGPSRRAGPP